MESDGCCSHSLSPTVGGLGLVPFGLRPVNLAHGGGGRRRQRRLPRSWRPADTGSAVARRNVKWAWMAAGLSGVSAASNATRLVGRYSPRRRTRASYCPTPSMATAAAPTERWQRRGCGVRSRVFSWPARRSVTDDPVRRRVIVRAVGRQPPILYAAGVLVVAWGMHRRRAIVNAADAAGRNDDRVRPASPPSPRSGGSAQAGRPCGGCLCCGWRRPPATAAAPR